MLTVPGPVPTISTMSASPLQRIDQLTGRLNRLTTERELAIARSLDDGATWAEVAQPLGCSTQAAHRRYRWLRYNPKTGVVWHELPLPL
jgi:hypothetical protein